MFWTSAYSVLLKMYPAEVREQFGQEMRSVFEQTAQQRRGLSLVWFGVRELTGVVIAALKERLFPSTPPRTVALFTFPPDIAETERYIRIVSGRLICAIANHDFPGARYYDLEDRKARAFLAQLRATS